MTDSLYLLQNVLPLLEALFAHVRHLLDGDDLLGEETPRVVHRAERAMPDFPQVLEYLLRVVLIEQFRYLGIFQAAWPRHRGHTLHGWC